MQKYHGTYEEPDECSSDDCSGPHFYLADEVDARIAGLESSLREISNYADYHKNSSAIARHVFRIVKACPTGVGESIEKLKREIEGLQEANLRLREKNRWLQDRDDYVSACLV